MVQHLVYSEVPSPPPRLVMNVIFLKEQESCLLLLLEMLL